MWSQICQFTIIAALGYLHTYPQIISPRAHNCHNYQITFLSYHSIANMDLASLKEAAANLTLYDLKAGVRKVQNGKGLDGDSCLLYSFY
jgi:hypothetical protein